MKNLIREFIRENDHWTTPSRTLAKILFNKYPSKFKSIESIRYVIRDIRNSAGHRFNKKDQEFADKFHGYMTPDLNEYSPFVIPDYLTNLLILNDIHIPFHHEKNLNAAINWAKKRKVDSILLNGDIIDCYKVSKFLKDRRMRDVVNEFEMLRNFIDFLNNEFDCPIFYKLGNHEERIENMVMREVPQLLEFITFESCLSNGGQFDCKDYNLDIIKDKRVVKYSGLSIIHGHEYVIGNYNPVGVARWLFLRTRSNAMCGDKHKVDEFSSRTITQKTIKTWAVGCLCDLNPVYRPLNDWQAGFAYVRRDSENFKVSNLTIENGKVY